jgi:hypothetical protein
MPHGGLGHCGHGAGAGEGVGEGGPISNASLLLAIGLFASEPDISEPNGDCPVYEQDL